MSHYPDFLHNVGQIYTATEVAELLGEDKFGPKYHWLVQQKCINPGPDGVTVLKYPGAVKPEVKVAPTLPEKKESSGKVETRAPEDQNEHTLCVVNSKQLQKNAMLVVMVANVEISLEAFRKGIPFHKVEKELTSEYLAGKTGLSKPTVISAMKEACKLGFLKRTDNGKGGKRNTNKAKYKATLPTYFTSAVKG